MRHRSPSRRLGAARQAIVLTALALSLNVPNVVRAQDAGGHSAGEVVLRPDRVFDAEAGRTRAGWAVLVRGDRIAAVGPVGDLTSAPGAEVIELPGTTLLPGMIEAHAHLFLHPYSETLWDDQVLKEARAYRTVRAAVHARQSLMSGFTTLRDLGTEGAGWADLGVRDAIEDGLIPGPRVLAATLALAATASYAPGPRGWDPDLALPQGAQPVSGEDEIRRAVREQAGRGADLIKVYADFRRRGGVAPTFTAAELAALVDEAHAAGLPVAAHASSAEGMRRATLAGVQTIEHGSSGTPEVFARRELARARMDGEGRHAPGRSAAGGDHRQRPCARARGPGADRPGSLGRPRGRRGGPDGEHRGRTRRRVRDEGRRGCETLIPAGGCRADAGPETTTHAGRS